MQKVQMSALRARAKTMAKELGVNHEAIELDLLAAHAKAQTPVVQSRVEARIQPIVVKQFKPDGRVIVTHAPSFADTVAVPAMQL
jgi:hypothetical protein